MKRAVLWAGGTVVVGLVLIGLLLIYTGQSWIVEKPTEQQQSTGKQPSPNGLQTTSSTKLSPEEESRQSFQEMAYQAKERLPIIFKQDDLFIRWKMTDVRYGVHKTDSLVSPLSAYLVIYWTYMDEEYNVSAEIRFTYALTDGEWQLVNPKVTVMCVKQGGKSIKQITIENRKHLWDDRRELDEIGELVHTREKARWAVTFMEIWRYGLLHTELGNIILLLPEQRTQLGKG